VNEARPKTESSGPRRDGEDAVLVEAEDLEADAVAAAAVAGRY